MDVNVHEALRGVPGWEDAQVEALPGGHTNHTWLLTAGERNAVLKIDATPRSSPYNTRAREARVQAMAADCGLAGRVLYSSDTVYLSEYLEGSVWTVGTLADNENIERLAEALRKLHALPLTGRTFDALSAARDYASRIVDADEARVRTCLRTIAAEPPGPVLSFCHNDLVVENIVSAPDTRFLDWEYACDNDPFFDLATITTHHGLSEEKAGVLLDAYFDGEGERYRERLARQAGVYAALLYLWELGGAATSCS
jgi:thiamine kinase-like enzyme